MVKEKKGRALTLDTKRRGLIIILDSGSLLKQNARSEG